ncbi:hypothetical protein SCACP_02940 [Sporomusa carbonis]|uniref:VOC family protein n=1 Tax=Sporomusa carbonis TaxID=3076075 RepID=UPI003A5DFBCB
MYNVAHIGVVVKDATKSSEFYTTVLGCQAVSGHQDDRVCLVFLKAGQQTIELIQYKQDAAGTRGAGVVDHIAFAVPDMEAALAHLQRHNVPLLFDQPKMVGNMKIMFFAGPDGERLEFVQQL